MPIAEAALVVLLVDFVSGVVHWAEDTFGSERTPVLGAWIVGPNVLHHRRGSAFVRNTWLESSWDLLAAGVTVIVVAWWAEALTWHVALFVALGANANQFHKWCHMRRSDIPVAVRWLQQLRLLQSPRHHAAHHRGGKDTCYCVVTEALNPLLDRAGLWRALERALVPVFGAPRRPDLGNLGFRP